MAPAPGPTARELLAVLQPQMDDIKSDIGSIRADTTYLRECAVRNAAQIAEHERRIGVLESKRQNGNGSGGGTTARLTPKEALLLVAGGALLGGAGGAGIAQLLKLIGG